MEDRKVVVEWLDGSTEVFYLVKTLDKMSKDFLHIFGQNEISLKGTKKFIYSAIYKLSHEYSRVYDYLRWIEWQLLVNYRSSLLYSLSNTENYLKKVKKALKILGEIEYICYQRH